MYSGIEIYNAVSDGMHKKSYPDFKIGKLHLAKHLGVTRYIGALAASAEYGRQLLLKVPSSLDSGRVPLYVCDCCADLGCGTVTVFVEKTDRGYRWSDFRVESSAQDGFSQSEYMERTGPFLFSVEEYTTIKPYS